MPTSIRLLPIFLLPVLILVASGAAAANGGNQLKDPGFELQLTPSQGGWTLFEQSRFSTRQARTGSQSMYNGGFSQKTFSPPFLLGSASGAYQEFPATPGSRWHMSGFGMAPSALRGTPAFGILQITFFDADGNDLGTVETSGKNVAPAKTSNQVNNRAPAGEWTRLDTGIATAPPGTASVQAFTLYVDYSAANVSQGVYFDDVVLCALPEDGAGSDCR